MSILRTEYNYDLLEAVCAASLARLTAIQEVPGSIPGLTRIISGSIGVERVHTAS